MSRWTTLLFAGFCAACSGGQPDLSSADAALHHRYDAGTKSDAGASSDAGTLSTGQVLLFGNATVASVGDSSSAGQAEAFSFKASQSGTVQSLKLYVDGANGASTIRVGVYSGGTAPTSLLGECSISQPAAGAWNSCTLSAGPAVTAGSTYWVAVLGPAGGGTPAFRDENGGTSISSSGTSLSDFQSSWSSGPSWPSQSLSVQALGTVSGVTGTDGGTSSPPDAGTGTPPDAGTTGGAPDAGTTGGTPDAGVAPQVYQEFMPPWNGNNSPDGVWRINGPWTGTGGNTMDPANAQLVSSWGGASGVLLLTSKANSLDGAEIQTLPSYGYGYYEVRMQVTSVPGVCDSFFWIESPNYGPHEIDVEFLTNESWISSSNSGQVHLTLHPSGQTAVINLPFNPALAFHRYGFLWTAGRVEYTVDGQSVYTFNDSNMATSAQGYIMMNTWTGNANWGGGPPTQDATTAYDWVKFYANATSILP